MKIAASKLFGKCSSSPRNNTFGFRKKALPIGRKVVQSRRFGRNYQVVKSSIATSSSVVSSDRDLLKNPMWKAEDLGRPIPPTPYGISVCLPLWEHVIGYEENDQSVVSKFQSGYPRFFMPPAIKRLVERVNLDCAPQGSKSLMFPRLIHAQRCAEFVQKKTGETCAVSEWGKRKIGVCTYPDSSECEKAARLYWRLSGEIVSSRQAEVLLDERPSRNSPIEGLEAVERIKSRLAELTGQPTENIFLFPSGMAASFAVHRMLMATFPNRKTAQLDFPYVDLLKVQENFGKGCHSLLFHKDKDENEVYQTLEALIEEEPLAGLFLETPSNPLLKCSDVARIVKMRSDAEKQSELPIILDDTVTSCLNIKAFEYADVVVTSLTKAFSGYGDVLAGSVILSENSPNRHRFKTFLDLNNDNSLWDEDSFKLDENSKDFSKRRDESGKNGEALYKFLCAHDAVETVFYPKSHGDDLFFKQFKPDTRGPLLSFVLKDRSRAPFVYDAMEFSKGPSLGTIFTLACPYTLLAHYGELDWAADFGVDKTLIRISCGVEPTAEILQRMERALAHC